MTDVVVEIEQVTPNWLSSLLRGKGILRKGAVTEVHQVTSAETSVSRVYHLAVNYEGIGQHPPAPTNLFLKISNPGFGGPEEVDFYNVVVPVMLSTDPHTDWPFAHCYDAAYSAKGKMYHVLLDDLSTTHSSISGLMPRSPRHCEAVIDAYALFHAFWWEHPRLGQDIGQLLTNRTIDSFLTSVADRLGQLVDEMSAELSQEDHGVLESVATAWPSRRRERVVAGEGITLVHRDPHPLNFLYPRDEEGGTAKLIDWQSWRVDTGTDDLAYLMACHWPSERFEQLELGLVKRYHTRLVEFGVVDYSWDDCWYDYRASVIRCVFFLIPAWAPGRWERLKRGIEAFKRWDCAELLAG